MNVHAKNLYFSVFLLFINLFLSGPALAQIEEEIRILQMYFKEDELVVTATRTPKPISQVAENITVIAAKEIENMNAHTLSDVLNTVSGVQMDIRGGPGSETNALIQGSQFIHVLVMIDGVALNNLSNNAADISSIPVQNIERIEIIKGPASSSWGSSLGGVINIITKSIEQKRKAGGTASASYGKGNTGDYRADASGTIDNVGYYIYTGKLISDGLRPNTNFYENNLYTKLKWDINKKTNMMFIFGYNRGSREQGRILEIDRSRSTDFEYLFSTLSMNYSINHKADLNFSFRTSRKNSDLFEYQLSTGEERGVYNYDDKGTGGSAKFTWKNDIHNIALGTDYDDGDLKSDSIAEGRQHLEKWAVFLNDTIAINEFSFTPGIRYDHTNTNGDFLSPSFGITYELAEQTIVRGYISRGFNIPLLSWTFGTGQPNLMPNPDLEVEKVWSYYAGMESAFLKYFWAKTTFFRHDINDAIDSEQLPDGTVTKVNKKKQRRQGIEAEIKTVPVNYTSLFTGLVLIDAKDRDTGERLQGIPRYTYDIGIQYDNNDSLKAFLKGHYIWWTPETYAKGKYNSFIWDANLSKKIFDSQKRSAEILLAAHNIFNGSQYLNENFKNPGRWIEGGVRLKF
jgi:vitamin B12 transporter